MSWIYLAAAGSLGGHLPRLCMNPAECEHGPPSIASSPTIPQPCSCRACSVEKSTARPSSAIYARLKLNGGGASGPSSAAGPARATAWQALEKAWRTSAAALLSKSSDWSVYFDQSLSSWRTSQASLLPPETGLDTSTPSWPPSGMSYDGRIYRLPTLGKLTSAGATGLWPSAAVANANGGQVNAPGTSATGKKPDGSKAQVSLNMAARTWGQWATARTSDTNGPGAHGDGGLDLRTQGHAWATIQAGDYKGANPKISEAVARHKAKGVNKQIGARDQAALWASIKATDGDKSSGSHRGSADTAPSQAVLCQRTACRPPHPDETTTPPGTRSSLYSSTLNPRFAEWLLGWRIGLTELESLATAWILERRKRRPKRSSSADEDAD